MTLAKALKQKNKLVKELAVLGTRLRQSNVVVVGKEPNYDFNKVLSEYYTKRKELVELKVAIQKANAGIIETIITMGELKSSLQVINMVFARDDEETVGYGENAKIIQYKSVMNQVQKDAAIKQIEDQIDELQEEIDKYNVNTTL